jgi:signal transduction histidine kinase/CheY-like chemotaxis protein
MNKRGFDTIDKTSKELKKLIIISVFGVFFVAGLGFLFDYLSGSLEKKTRNNRIKLDIIKQIESNTLGAKYDFIKALSLLEKKHYQEYKNSSLSKIKKSKKYIKILKNGGKIKLENDHTKKLFVNDKVNNKLYKLLDDRLYNSMNKYFPIFDEELKESIKSKDPNTIIAAQELISLQSEEIVKLFNERVELLNQISKEAHSELRAIQKNIENQKEIYYYAQALSIFSIILLLLLSTKPIINDIIKTNQDLHKADRAKSEFLANMSHEIRTPLNAIMGFIDLLREGEKDQKRLKYLNTIHSSSQTLVGIINDILDFSKIESGNLNIDLIDFNVDSEFKSLVALFSAKAKEKNIKLTLHMSQNFPAALHSDPLRIKQIIANLLSNAIKFTPEGGSVDLYIGYKNETLQVAVKDSGMGIPKEKQKQIFDAFKQAENSTTRKFGGTGLGLSISSKLVEMLGGELKVKSEVHKGSIFYFNIQSKVGKYKRIDTQSNANANIKGKKILLVEDNKANQAFMSIVLKKLELEFDIANDGYEAISAFNKKRYDLILMDENMPNLNGIEATKKIIEIEQEKLLPHIPIVALTANALKGDRERFLEAGMDEYLTKPLDRDLLAKTIDKLTKQEEYIC